VTEHEDRIQAYASALFEVARAEGTLAVVEDELFKVARSLESNDALREGLTDQRLPVEVRQGIVEDLLGPRASPSTTSLVSFVVGAGRARDLPAIIDGLVARAAESRAESVALVTSASPLDAETQKRLADALSKRLGHKVAVKVNVDPSILGGLITQVGDTVIDGSVRSRLEQLRSSF
jgi:F-type H+-transporting ATPase subunit delta